MTGLCIHVGGHVASLGALACIIEVQWFDADTVSKLRGFPRATQKFGVRVGRDRGSVGRGRVADCRVFDSV